MGTFYPNRLSAYVGIGLFYGLAQGFSGAIIFLFAAELFPAKVRCHGIALSYIGGFGSMICQALYNLYPHVAPGVWFSATGALSAITIIVSVTLQKSGCVQLTHRRSSPYFGKLDAQTRK